jgi:hypothetical protein
MRERIFLGFEAILIEINNRSWWLQLFMLPPPPLGNSPPIAITPDKVEIYPAKRGGQGDAPLGLLPPLGERGGHSPSCGRE